MDRSPQPHSCSSYLLYKQNRWPPHNTDNVVCLQITVFWRQFDWDLLCTITTAITRIVFWMSHVGPKPPHPECFWNEKRALMYLLGLLRGNRISLLKYSMVAAKAEFAEQSCRCTSSWKLKWISCLLTSAKLSLCYTVSEDNQSEIFKTSGHNAESILKAEQSLNVQIKSLDAAVVGFGQDVF